MIGTSVMKEIIATKYITHVQLDLQERGDEDSISVENTFFGEKLFP